MARRTLAGPPYQRLDRGAGGNVGLQMRIYFSDEAEANAEDPILSRREHQMRVPTLIAQKQDDGSYRFDVHV